jgi:molybdopterin synthase catalytic subunit
MIVRIKLFAVARQRTGQDTVEINIAGTNNSVNVGRLKAALTEECPVLADIIARSRLAIDNEYVADESLISEDAEVALIPPVSGG